MKCNKNGMGCECELCHAQGCPCEYCENDDSFCIECESFSYCTCGGDDE